MLIVYCMPGSVLKPGIYIVPGWDFVYIDLLDSPTIDQTQTGIARCSYKVEPTRVHQLNHFI